MKIVKPITIAPTQYLAYPTNPNGYSNLTDYPEWNIATPYVVGNRVIVDSLQSQFEAVAPSTGTVPTLTMTTPWLRVGATNAWRFFDRVLSVPFNGYVAPGTAQTLDCSALISLSEIFGRFDTVAILETNAVFASLQVRDQNNVYSFNNSRVFADNSNVRDYWDYFFGDMIRKSCVVFDELKGWGSTSPGSRVTIGIDTSITPGIGVSGVLRVGEVVIGQSFTVGQTKTDPTKRLVDFSRKEADQFGNITIVQRSYSYESTFDIKVEPSRKALVEKTIAKLRATPCLFYPSKEEAEKGVYIFGLIKEFEITYSTPEVVHATLSVQGLT